MAKPWLNSVMGLVTGLVIATGGISTAATPTVTYFACLKSGALSLVGTKAPTCPKGATRISWNATGAAGAQGPAGPAGSVGAPGLNGSHVAPPGGLVHQQPCLYLAAGDSDCADRTVLDDFRSLHH